MSSTRITRRIDAPRAAVYRALLDPSWKVPAGMTIHVHSYDAREGGTLRISLTYDAADARGKTAAKTDTYRGRIERLVEDELLVEVDEFETDDPALQGEMRMTIELADAPGGGTEVRAAHDGVPPGISPADNEVGWNEALARLAALVET